MTDTSVVAGGLQPTPVDPFRTFPPRSYEDAHVLVTHRSACPAPEGPLVVATAHFALHRSADRLQVIHDLQPHELNNDVTSLLVDELFTPGWLHGNQAFESVFTGLVRTTVDDPIEAWLVFYRNTLRALQEARTAPADTGLPCTTTVGMAPVYDRVLELVPSGRVLDLGSCFGFLPLLMAQTGRYAVTATDISPPTMSLLATVASAWRQRVETVVCDAARVPLPDDAADFVSVVHLIEHLEPAHGLAVVREALRLASRQVIVAVPLETVPTMEFGHVRTFDLSTLAELGRAAGTGFTVDEHHGGWLILDPT
ncbi:mycofactocin oligosaccharide methyltransferase MftM [Candidatus Mycolicibacterium alkanivorans]|uniref:Class I SAM-dependent methyltransferase n=1 Tax=Candidatus Mycolicibacterium alkanivorans TaxID=2954114 RepID=A0ABS9YYM7_9MYCO|nr:mycofactocin oligosaccharide methyltransferase MftM [Candidatus Mycolicibacterium alkanivorans]MCI4676360.1 class I SAM-dependent methyltransferase [Candidatus Mycolicibacterium alkanivorans]